ncbi:hypothetical protein QM012_001193 [Aureobasidium pullulans]|uniref:DUF3835 domain-containing protein n=1 Tax=Aureobasidium pullulans TaxID=5580 RepID=A0ABR0TFY9_AURPU
MDDDETRRLILRLQMEDLASIWVSSTTSADDGTELDADLPLRLYRHELRAANQQIDDSISARAAAEDELRRRDTMKADREEAHRLFQELNPDEPLPELSEHDQLSTGHLGTDPVKNESSSALGSLQCSEQRAICASPSLSPGLTIASTFGVKRSSDHLDALKELPSKKQANRKSDFVARHFGARWVLRSDRAPENSIDETSKPSDEPAQIALFPPSASANFKRPAQDDDSIFPRAKKQDFAPKNSLLTSGATQSAAGKSASSSLSGPDIAHQRDVSSVSHMFGKSLVK